MARQLGQRNWPAGGGAGGVPLDRWARQGRRQGASACVRAAEGDQRQHSPRRQRYRARHHRWKVPFLLVSERVATSTADASAAASRTRRFVCRVTHRLRSPFGRERPPSAKKTQEKVTIAFPGPADSCLKPRVARERLGGRRDRLEGRRAGHVAAARVTLHINSPCRIRGSSRALCYKGGIIQRREQRHCRSPCRLFLLRDRLVLRSGVHRVGGENALLLGRLLREARRGRRR